MGMKKSTCGLPKYKGDGNCDDENNNKGCAYDGGDCCAKTVTGGVMKTSYCKECKCIDPASKSASTCGLPKFKGDGNCDDVNNNKGCAYDGGDCCAKSVKGGVVKTSFCTQCKCIDPASKSASTCADPKYKGDGNCDDANNNKGCAYDGGDCCAKTVPGGVVKTSYCKECKCIDPASKGASTCADAKYKGDGNCDDANNNAGCAYDG